MNKCKCGCGALVNKNFAPGHNMIGTKRSAEAKRKTKESLLLFHKDAESRSPDEMRICACGCGETFKASKYWKQDGYKEKEYVTGHASRRPESRAFARESIKKATIESRKVNRGARHNWYKGQSYISLVRGRYTVKCLDGSSVIFARIVMEDKIGRPLKDGEVVHHIDCDKLNDNPDNLMLFKNNSEHTQWHWDNDPVYIARKCKKVSKPCECGCGNITAKGKRFISGHNGRLSENGKFC